MSKKETSGKPENEIRNQNEQVDESTPTEIEPEDKWLVSLYLSTYIIHIIYIQFNLFINCIICT